MMGGDCECAHASASAMALTISTARGHGIRVSSFSAARSVRPSRNSSAITSCPSTSIDAKLRTIPGCSRCARICISFKKRRRPSSCRVSSGRSTFNATRRLERRSSASYTFPIPPSPTSRVTRYSPIRSMSSSYGQRAQRICPYGFMNLRRRMPHPAGAPRRRPSPNRAAKPRSGEGNHSENRRTERSLAS